MKNIYYKLIILNCTVVLQLFHACSGNSQNYCTSVLKMTWELLPSASDNSSEVISSTWVQ
jgi:hypothetical protein